jgi:IS30 family transposase
MTTIREAIGNAQFRLEQAQQRVGYWQEKGDWEYADTLMADVTAADLELNTLLERAKYLRELPRRRYEHTRQSIIDGVLARINS